MRVVSGDLKGRILKAVPGISTRPTTDKVKESLFNMIGPYFNGGLGLDLFAGSGGLGIEALSRGLDKVIFVDREGKAIQTVNENLKACRLEDRAEVYKNDAVRALKAIKKRGLAFHYIFLDPPYKRQQLVRLLEIIEKEQLIVERGLIVCEHSSDIEMPMDVGKLKQSRNEKYGIIGVTLYRLDGHGEGEIE
ncbi:16S rRNA (guanine(966)-N(2))-methyltransferase RsmD [Bacillus sp. REN3]|uniref:16S rRNA (guanine(966)-N(2))-methyltransferase RsmD n=1 Tax=Bacillus sp. REN3 TaxID=2802440 RepID=UPI001AEEAEB3|nr:16S rRNA (guanine(966)-N(2))-methyltransferase RsmD [Bacillus sp. REN3]